MAERQPPERQHATAGDVFREGKAMGGNAAELCQLLPGAVQLCADEWPEIGREWAQLLNALPAACDCVEGWGWKWPLAAEVEVRLIGQRWEQISELSAVQIRHNDRAPSKFVSVLDSKPGLLHGFNVWRMALKCEH